MRGAAATLATLGAALLLCLPGRAARAEPDELAEARQPTRRHRSAEILLDMDDAVRVDREEGGRFRLRKRYGFEYAHRLDVGEHPLVFSIQGPALPRKGVGLSIEFRF
jgi:hypothetical protein